MKKFNVVPINIDASFVTNGLQLCKDIMSPSTSRVFLKAQVGTASEPPSPRNSPVMMRSCEGWNGISGSVFNGTNDFWATSSTDVSLSKGYGAYNNGGTAFLLDRNTAWMYFGDRIYFTSTGGIDAADTPPEPTALALSQNYPNPFTTHTTIPYSISGNGEEQLRIELYDAMGRRIATLFDGSATAGEHVLPFDASGFVPGMYFVRLVTGGRVEVRKMVVVRGDR
ncbi:MAG: T9SS type A sorting domain-containing protein [Ignavibacteria bacterium]|nr:T9SS type A sorting domain-containing protein [Ignavibacteria bacterium]